MGTKSKKRVQKERSRGRTDRPSSDRFWRRDGRPESRRRRCSPTFWWPDDAISRYAACRVACASGRDIWCTHEPCMTRCAWCTPPCLRRCLDGPPARGDPHARASSTVDAIPHVGRVWVACGRYGAERAPHGLGSRAESTTQCTALIMPSTPRAPLLACTHQSQLYSRCHTTCGSSVGRVWPIWGREGSKLITNGPVAYVLTGDRRIHRNHFPTRCPAWTLVSKGIKTSEVCM